MLTIGHQIKEVIANILSTKQLLQRKRTTNYDRKLVNGIRNFCNVPLKACRRPRGEGSIEWSIKFSNKYNNILCTAWGQVKYNRINQHKTQKLFYISFIKLINPQLLEILILRCRKELILIVSCIFIFVSESV